MNKLIQTIGSNLWAQRCAFTCALLLALHAASGAVSPRIGMGWLLPPLEAADVKGQVRVGTYTRELKFKEARAGETSNDEKVYSAQLRLDVRDLNDESDRFLFDFRDKYDSYGKLERQNLRLGSYNRMQIRTMAYQRPWESNRFYFTFGRYSLIEANILANDGVEAGYRFSKALRAGSFAGQGAKDVLTPLYVDPKEQAVNNLQAGAYLTYETKNSAEDSSYITQAIAQAPTYDITDKASHRYYFQQGQWNLSASQRLASSVVFDFDPASALRRASISHMYSSERIRTNTYIQQTKAEDYLLAQTIQDRLKPSPVQTLGFDLRQRLGKTLAFDYSTSYGRRTEDGLSQNEFAFGILLPGMLVDAASLRSQVGLRNNFESKDTFVRFGFDYWARTFGLGLSHLISNESYKTGEKDKRRISTLDLSWFFAEDLRGSLGYQMEADDKVSASALFVMVGYRFGAASVSPIRTKPPRFESM